ncbi:hypothetical protein F2Q70_00003360 [Brassica cretica]|uniref:Uncharacterized protein n=1 Tax=Brassica cretica TaxID=69181 RepID=A0A8S9ITQ7_BRACR|nr:hypothetical protein F2Q70_00003360 [Brassica cretica]
MEDVVTAETDGEEDVIPKEERFKGQSKRLDPFIVYISIGLGIYGCFHLNPHVRLKIPKVLEVAQAEEEAVNEGSFLNFGISVPISEFSNDDVLFVRVYIVIADCEPVAIKFMELNALGNPHRRMDGMTDDLVDIMRKQFAMDYYKDGVVPVYVENETK